MPDEEGTHRRGKYHFGTPVSRSGHVDLDPKIAARVLQQFAESAADLDGQRPVAETFPPKPEAWRS